jgi:hypothetical protein
LVSIRPNDASGFGAGAFDMFHDKAWRGNAAFGYRALGDLKTAHFAARGLSEKDHMSGDGSDAK